MFYWAFINRKLQVYYIVKDSELSSNGRWSLDRDGYEIVFDSARSQKHAIQTLKVNGEYMDYDFNNLSPLNLKIQPLSLREAKEFVSQHHRHHPPPQGHKFSIGVSDGKQLIGVAIGGRPVSRHLDDGFTLEITRCCVKEGYRNACSRLLGAMVRIAKNMGYSTVYTYTLLNECGASLRASGFSLKTISKGGSWKSKCRPRENKHPLTPKKVWIKTT